MTRKELTRNYRHNYRMLEDKFLATTNYVEINSGNFCSFSNEYALLIQSIGAELEIDNIDCDKLIETDDCLCLLFAWLYYKDKGGAE